MMKNNQYCVYKHTSPSGKCYIGITRQNPIKRWGQDGCNYVIKLKNGNWKHPAFAPAILKYGWNNIIHEILHAGLTKKQACEYEKLYIKLYKKEHKSYNITDGGEGASGINFTPEQIERMRLSHIGLKQTKETIEKRVNKNKGKHRTKSSKMKRSKPVLQFDKCGNFISEYFGLNEAQRITGARHISECCNGYRRTDKGFIWKWKLNDKCSGTAHPDAKKLADELKSLMNVKNIELNSVK